VSKELDTSWFDLKKYDKLNELDLRGWYYQIHERLLCCHHLNNNDLIRYYTDVINEIKTIGVMQSKTLAIRNNFIDKYEDEKYPFNTMSVSSITAMQYWQVESDDLEPVQNLH
jgi:hypothetical protein